MCSLSTWSLFGSIFLKAPIVWFMIPYDLLFNNLCLFFLFPEGQWLYSRIFFCCHGVSSRQCFFPHCKNLPDSMPNNKLSMHNNPSNGDRSIDVYVSNNHINNSFSSTYFHKYKIVNMTSNGNIINLQNNLQLISVGSQELNTGFNYFILPENNLQKTIDSSVCSLEVNSLNLLFILSVEKHFYARKKNHYFYPLLASNQYSLNSNNDGFEIHPNNSLLTTYDETKTKSLLDHQSQNGVACILTSGQLQNDEYYIQTQFLKKYQVRFDLLESLMENSDSFPPFLNGIDQFLILDFTKDSVSSLNCQEHTSKQSHYQYKLSLQHLVLPNKRIANFGCKVIDLPFVLVEIGSNKTSTSKTQYIQSNHSQVDNKASFIVPMDSVECCCNSTDMDGFVTIKCDQSSIDFSPYDLLHNLHFKILLPNGETLQYEDQDYTIPFTANESLNISLFLKFNHQ